MRTRFSNTHFTPYGLFVLTWLLLALSSSALAESMEDDFFLNGLAKQQQHIIETQHALPDWLKAKPMQLDATLSQSLQQGYKHANPGENASQTIGGDGIHPGRWIFVSFGMPDEELKAAAKEAAETHSALVFRGVAEGENTGALARRLYRLVNGIQPMPGAVIDPLLFKRFGVKAVPTMVVIDKAGLVRSVRGLPGFAWLSKQDIGDAGQKGQVYTIAEPDMIEEIQRRIRVTDWKKQKQDALANFWKGQGKGLDLPNADRNLERLIDPSLRVTQDIVHPDGRLIAKKGQKINPQTLMPMQHAYIVFDATQPDQVDLAKKWGDAYLRNKKPVVYLFTKMDTQNGWTQFNATVQQMNAPVYQLNKALMNRFQIKALPSVIEGQGYKLVIREIHTEK
ncbi:MAG: TrbC family F-type conjugative pilus assembly protein [Methylovulum sp.]|nr:TrbC family F-type conjugative pilus assembly protein [Methylovulum sp.]